MCTIYSADHFSLTLRTSYIINISISGYVNVVNPYVHPPAALHMVYESMNNPCGHNQNVNNIASIVLNRLPW